VIDDPRHLVRSIGIDLANSPNHVPERILYLLDADTRRDSATVTAHHEHDRSKSAAAFAGLSAKSLKAADMDGPYTSVTQWARSAFSGGQD